MAITKSQLIRINRSLNDYAHLKKVNQSLQRELIVSDSLCFYWKQIATTADNLYFKETQKYEQLAEVNTSLQAALNERKRKSRKIGIGVGVGGTLLGVVLGVLLGK